jgi:FkbM family methyltransferase
MISYAQNFEDVILARVFKEVVSGFYIDVGAMDPVDASVTNHFYDLGWHGINVEPDTRFYEKLVSERPRDINLNLAIGAVEEIRTFYHSFQKGISTFSSTVCDHFSRQSYLYKKEERQLTTLARICQEHAHEEIHFLKVDAEGWEGEIIRGGDWTRFRPLVVLLEGLEPSTHVPVWPEWENDLIKFGYIFAYDDGLNRFYLREESKDLAVGFRAPPNIFDGFQLFALIQAEQERDEARAEGARLRAEIEQLAIRADKAAEELEKERLCVEQLSRERTLEQRQVEQLTRERNWERERFDWEHQRLELERLRSEQLAQEKLVEQERARQLTSDLQSAQLRSEQLAREKLVEQERAHELTSDLQSERLRSEQLAREKMTQMLWLGQANQERAAQRLRAEALQRELEALKTLNSKQR